MLKEPDKDIQKLLKPSSSGDLSREVFHSPAGAEEEAVPGHSASLLHITERRREYGGGEERLKGEQASRTDCTGVKQTGERQWHPDLRCSLRNMQQIPG